jgi:hypothetical protein
MDSQKRFTTAGEYLFCHRYEANLLVCYDLNI